MWESGHNVQNKKNAAKAKERRSERKKNKSLTGRRAETGDGERDTVIK